MKKCFVLLFLVASVSAYAKPGERWSKGGWVGPCTEPSDPSILIYAHSNGYTVTPCEMSMKKPVLNGNSISVKSGGALKGKEFDGVNGQPIQAPGQK